MVKVLVIGASGGIGLETVKAAVHTGHKVRAGLSSPPDLLDHRAARPSDKQARH